MGYNAFLQVTKSIGYKTELLDTVIYKLVPSTRGLKLAILRLTILTGGTAHVLTVMRPLNKTTASAAALASQKVVNITADPGSIATNDYCVIRLSDGTYQLNKVASVDTLAITFTDNFTASIESGAPVYFMGVVGDGHEQRVLTASTENTFESEYGEFVTDAKEDPIVLSIDNATAASIIQGGTVALTTC